jgi:hypothetical protein
MLLLRQILNICLNNMRPHYLEIIANQWEMGIATADEERRFQLALKAIADSKFKLFAMAARYFYVKYDVLRSCGHGICSNHSCDGKNKALLKDKDAVLRLYCERTIKLGLPPE